MEPAICIEMFFPGKSAEEKLAAVAGRGFRNVEFWGLEDKNIETYTAAAREYGIRTVNFSGHRRGDLIDKTTHPLVLEDFRESSAAARRIGAGILMVLSNELGDEGRVLHPRPDIPESEKRRNLVEGLSRIMEAVPEDLTIVLEPLNTVLDHPGNYLSSVETASGVIREVGHPRLKILCDLYHQGMMGDDLEAIILKYTPSLGHIHVADYPGRHEPGTGSADWVKVLRLLDERGYTGFVGFECSPAGDSNAALDAIRALWEKVCPN